MKFRIANKLQITGMESVVPRRGFSFIEVIIAVAILVTLSFVVAGSLFTFRETAALDQALDEAQELLREARSRTLGSDVEGTYGVHFASTTVTLFIGPYVPGSPANTVVSLPVGVIVSAVGLSTTTASVMFERLTGDATAAGLVTFSTTRSGKMGQLEILPSGAFLKL